MADRIPRRADDLVRDAGRAILRELVQGTPADTGRARSNWQVGLGAPKGGTVPAFAPGSRLGINETGNASAAITAGDLVLSTRSRGSSVWITNNVDYIGKLNDGSSKQAPANFVEAALAAGVRAVNDERVTEPRRGN